MTAEQKPGGSALWREPLLHFLLIGAAIFLLYRVLNGEGAPAPREIVVTPTHIAALKEGFSRTWLRQPTPEELRGLIDEHVREEVYYREAIAMGLDRDDTVVRRRLRQKMEFLTEDVASAAAPGDAQLEEFLQRNPDKFATPLLTSFEQVYFNVGQRGEAARRDAAQLLKALRAGQATAGPGTLGDATLLPPDMTDASPRDVESVLGAGFVTQLDQAPLGQWAGPFESAYGLHLVRVTSRKGGDKPVLAQVRPLVEREWQAEQAHRRAEEFFQSLLAKYEVRVETGEAAKP
ncbi:MAG: peptidyl-prolyl cis-trans isomerase [Gammaproteobacteria bacterium]|nr:peptidyl-prolyl cis-trans isomerase [Gammaproteobacteria bacterium]